jgi:hypothetical protein
MMLNSVAYKNIVEKMSKKELVTALVREAELRDGLQAEVNGLTTALRDKEEVIRLSEIRVRDLVDYVRAWRGACAGLSKVIGGMAGPYPEERDTVLRI